MIVVDGKSIFLLLKRSCFFVNEVKYDSVVIVVLLKWNLLVNFGVF